MARHLLPVACVSAGLLAGLAGCATTPETPPTSGSSPSAPEGDAGSTRDEAAAAPAPPTSPAGDPPPSAVAPAASSAPAGTARPDRTDDGIDDENWLPRKDTRGYSLFLTAVETARRDPRQAVGQFVDAAKASPGFYAAWFNAGASAEAVTDLASAESHYRKALEVRPDYGPALVNLAVLMDRTNREGAAKALVADALKKFPTRAGPHLAAGTRALRQRDLTTAESEAREAIKQDERNVAAMLLMAQVFRAEGRFDTARFAVDNALALEPGNALLHLERAQVLLGQKDRKEALFAAERAARLRPSLAEAQQLYGVLLLEHGLSSEAVDTFQRLAAMAPTSAKAQLNLGNALRAQKQYAQAEAAYTKALALNKDLDEVHFNLGLLYLDNVLPGVDELARLEKALAELTIYRDRGTPDAATKARLLEYIENADKLASRERKRREREQKRQASDAAKAEKAAAEKAAAEKAAAEKPAAAPAPAAAPGAPPPPPGGPDDK